MQRVINNALSPLKRAVGNMLARGVVVLVNSASKMQTLQVKLLHDEVKQDIEHFEPYGFTSCPKAGAETITAFLGGDRSHGVVLVVADRRYRLTGLAGGEMAIHDDLGQKVHLTRGGIVVSGAGLPMKITDIAKLRIESDVEVTGQVKDLCDTSGMTMATMRSKYNAHVHPNPEGGNVGTATPGM